ncbi:FG-GAP-like repeat-containing protein [Pseudoxanthomonas sacheonensis]|uniref:Sugar lactone lactonase YvrE n=1 Tax=Pseudoxanthomonas sacheonensis TaxID=443615 RepID=A0ABU1RRX0_9GAMM|nr:FG-GAP-like repeat-containing protein [Pseudoxanthomonas sacheonensis]MDR6841521.1 sugar lactone lactonase YvrE [Pseudoxanthomonas sacheonensis]
MLLLSAGMVQAAAPSDPIITFVAGGGVPGVLGDGGPATSAYLDGAYDIEMDAQGNLYVADKYNYRVRKISAAGTISTVAGNGTDVYGGTNIPATSTGMVPAGIALDAAGNLYIADAKNARVRKVSTAGIITNFAGNGIPGYGGDRGPAYSASMYVPDDVEVDKQGNVYVLDIGFPTVRKIAPDGIISTIVGDGQSGASGDGGPAQQARISPAEGIDVDDAGNLYIADTRNNRVRRVDTAGVIRTVAGGGTFSDDSVAKNLVLSAPMDVKADGRNNLYVALSSSLVRMVTESGATQIVAGTLIPTSAEGEGQCGWLGDNGPANRALLCNPTSVELDAAGNLYISQLGSIRKVTPVQPVMPPGLNAFSSYSSPLVQDTVVSIVSGDVNDDGRDDVVYSTAQGSNPDAAKDYRVNIMLQTANGTLAAPIGIAYAPPTTSPSSQYPNGSLELGDFNNDGILDIVVSHEKGIGLVVGKRQADFVLGSFSGQFNMPTGELMAIDINRDGKLDIVAKSLSSTSATNEWPGLGLYFGDGQGQASVRSYMAFSDSLGQLRQGDFNGDGWNDIASSFSDFLITNGGSDGGAVVFFNNRNMGFQQATKTYSVDRQPNLNASVGDFNGDGRQDVVTAFDGVSGNAAINLYLQGNMGLLPPVRVPSYMSPERMLTADMDGNGRDDLLVMHYGHDALGYYTQAGAGLVRETKYYVPYANSPSNAAQPAIGDVNGDGYKDVVVFDYNPGISILYGTGKVTGLNLRMNGSQALVPGGANQPSTTGNGATQALVPSLSATNENNASVARNYGSRALNFAHLVWAYTSNAFRARQSTVLRALAERNRFFGSGLGLMARRIVQMKHVSSSTRGPAVDARVPAPAPVAGSIRIQQGEWRTVCQRAP